jgi:uncharacterized protein (TIGR02271 family)
MSRIVMAGFQEEPDAQHALARLSEEVALIDGGVVGRGPLGSVALQNLELSESQQASCLDKLQHTPFIVVARVPNELTVERAVGFLRSELAGYADEGGEAPGPAPADAAADEAPDPAPAAPVEEQSIPLVEEELRVGKRQVVRGGARVTSIQNQAPVRQDVGLFEEQANVERRPANRRLTDEEVAASGLLTERVIEIGEMREEAVISKEAFVREELIVRKSATERVEHIEETVRRMDAEIEEIEPDPDVASSRPH